MKISKINGRRTGIIVNEKSSYGILYNNIASRKKVETNLLESYIQERIENTQKLYQIFILKNDKRKKVREEQEKEVIKKKAIENFEILINELGYFNKRNNTVILQMKLLKNLPSQQVYCKKKKKKIDAISLKIEMEDSSCEKMVEEIVNSYLRNSLRKQVSKNKYDENSSLEEKEYSKVSLPKIIKQLFYSMCCMDTYQEKFSQIDDKELEVFLKVFNEDYTKNIQKEFIIKSIQQKKSKVELMEKNGKIYLCPSTAKNENKKYIFEFMKEYTKGDKNTQEDMLKHFRKLILCYYCGIEIVNTEEDTVTAWSFGSQKPESEKLFSDKAVGLIQERIQSDKKYKRKLNDDIRQEIRTVIAEKYRIAVKRENISKSDQFWISYIEECTEKILLKKAEVRAEKLSLSYLCDQVWKNWIAFMGTKFIEFGKAVYHFAIPDLQKVVDGETISIGEVLPEFQEGISSFDYERIKAEESLEREIACYIAIAINNFDRAIRSPKEREIKGREDILSCNREQGKLVLKKNTIRRILQFFGGISTWENVEAVNVEDIELVCAMIQELSLVRNSSFHYISELKTPNKENLIVKKLFLHEYNMVGQVYRQKYYSNNVPIYYKENDITTLMNILYSAPKQCPAQVPAFQRILNPTTLIEFIPRFIKKNSWNKLIKEGNDSQVVKNFRSALFFILKDIYYYQFFQEKNIKGRFLTELKKIEDIEKDKNRQRAIKDFKYKVFELSKNTSFGEICQILMTEYTIQNTDKKEVSHQVDFCQLEKKLAAEIKEKNNKNSDVKKRMSKNMRVCSQEHSQIYKHYPMILYQCLKETFLVYLKEKTIYAFLREPVYKEEEYDRISEEIFCKDWKAHTFDHLIKEEKIDAAALAWYTTAHFLSRKQLNHLIGSIKNYRQFIIDIDRRSQSVGNKKGVGTERKIHYYEKILDILEFSMLFCGKISNKIEDYFENDEYAECLSNYIQFEESKETVELGASVKLRSFCDQTVKGGINGKIGIYYDEKKPVLNRNVVMATLYGNEILLSKCMEKITKEEISQYYKEKSELEQVFKKGFCSSKEEQEKLKKFQNAKNRVELLDVNIYSEIINDLHNQLISWSYFRERDMIYFQLGFYYTKLFYGESIGENDRLKKLEGEKVHITDGAILYQIIAMYAYHLPVYGINQKGQAYLPEKAGTGVSVNSFNNDYCSGNRDIYINGLCFFENINEHRDIVNIRNYIDHFKYYARSEKTILELYSEVYDRFFTYDMKLKKSVSFILKNIVMRYFVILATTMEHYRERNYKILDKKQVIKKVSEIALDFKRFPEGMCTDYFTYKITKEDNKKEEVEVPVREEIFLRQLRKILEYKIM